jgi:ABC-type glycerol-3-phosphate transport system substrate-binding protein
MKVIVRAAAVVGVAAAIAAGAIGAGFGSGRPRPTDALAMRDGDEWVTWWQLDRSPARWDG